MTDRAKYKRAKEGDIAYNMMRMWQGAVGSVPVDGLVSPAYVVARPLEGCNALYFSYLFRTAAYQQEVNNASRGIVSDRNRLYWVDFKPLPSVVPPPEEQAAVVRFLGHANRRIDLAIQAKKKLIVLLNEQKQAIIHQAVTRGLDSNVRLKPSGVGCLRDVPEHWEHKRLKTLSVFITSGSRGWARFYSDSGSIFLRIGNISTSSIDLRLDRISYVTPPADTEGERTRAKANDILLSITAQIGAVGIVPTGFGEAFVNQHTALIRLRSGISVPRWVAYVLLSRFGKEQCQLLTNGGTKVGLTLDDVRCLSIICPPVEEQVRIVSEIEKRSGALNTSIAHTEREIALIQEYRTRLISDVVTGKLNVREAARHLPDETEELNTLEADNGDVEFELELDDIVEEAGA
jgi:type I restriction enzyme S subunit